MKAVKSAAAEDDVRQAVDYYLNEAGPDIALQFIDELEKVTKHVGDWPGSGSARFAEILGIPGLRSFALARFPYVVFYIEEDDHVDIWRVLHGKRDIPAVLS